MITKKKVLESLDIGNGVAELERELLGEFFFESSEWKKLKIGKLDFILGPKGSGKSALFFHLLDHRASFSDNGILLVSSENTTGDSVFRTIDTKSENTEEDFIRIWKLYFLILILDTSKKNGINSELNHLIEELLVREKLYNPGWSLKQLFSGVVNYVKSRLYFESLGGEVSLDGTGSPSALKTVITFGNPTVSQEKSGIVSIDSILQQCNNTLVSQGYKVWILIDRLDAIFPSDKDLERNALRALVRTYVGMNGMPAICPKIFLRNDLWHSITKGGGFREASHLSPVTARIHWSKATLAEMLLKRFLRSYEFCSLFGKSEDFMKSNSNDKMNFLYSLFPDNMTLYGEMSQKAFDWLIMYTMDGQDVNAPRDLIELMNAAIEFEVVRLSKGDTPYRRSNMLFNLEGLAHAGSVVSQTKMEQTIFAEYPELREYIDCFMNSNGRNYDLEKLRLIWNVDKEKAQDIASSLVEVGVFKKAGPDRYLIPVLYTGYLKISPSKKRYSG